MTKHFSTKDIIDENIKSKAPPKKFGRIVTTNISPDNKKTNYTPIVSSLIPEKQSGPKFIVTHYKI